jgi:hypothetical protein
MRGERQLLRLGEYLVRRACRQLPPDVREERYREWTAELPAILHDPQVRFAPWRAVRMLGYAADTLRGTAMTPGTARGRISRLGATVDVPLQVACLVVVAVSVWAVVQAPGNALNYLRLVWGLLFVASVIRNRVRPAGRTTALLGTSAILAAWAVLLGGAALAPGNWVNYVLAALILLPLVAYLPFAWWHRRRQARTGGHNAADR